MEHLTGHYRQRQLILSPLIPWCNPKGRWEMVQKVTTIGSCHHSTVQKNLPAKETAAIAYRATPAHTDANNNC